MVPSSAIASSFLLFATGVLSYPAVYERDGSLSCPTSDASTFTATSGAPFIVQCGIDHYGGDLSMVWTDTLDECINSCDSTPSCVAIAFRGPDRGPCYMKSTVQAGVSNDAVWGAVLQSSLTSTGPASSSSAPSTTTPTPVAHVCPDADGSTITTTSGAQFLVECGIDHFGGDISNQLTHSLDDCIALCDSTSGCVDVSWNGPAPGSCYLKNSIQTGATNAGIWGAKLISSTTSSSTSSSPAATTPTAASLACPAADGTTVGHFIVQCFVDHYGGDMGTVTTNSLDDCFSQCDATAGCEAVSWVGPAPGRCYLKNTVNDGHADSGVWGGQLVSTLPSSSTPTPTPMPVPTPIILSYFYGGEDQTGIAKANVISGNDIIIDTEHPIPIFGGPFNDPWPGVPKSMSVLYEYGTDMRVFASGDTHGLFTLTPDDTTHELIGFPAPSGTKFQILAVIWGIGEIRDEAVYQKLYSAAASGSPFAWSNDFFGTDTWVGIHKSGLVWYKDASGNIQYLEGREYTQGSWPQM